MRPSLLTAAATLLLVTALTVALTESRARRTGVNGVPPSAYVQRLKAGQSSCQATTVPRGTTAIGMYVGLYHQPAQPLEVSLTQAGTAPARTRLPADYTDGEIRAAIPTARATANGIVCVRDLGDRALALAGVRAPQVSSTLDGRGQLALLDLSFYAKSTSAFGFAPAVARRVGLLTVGNDGSWLFWLLVGAMIAVAIGAVSLIIREVSLGEAS
jgi:hypothetical protein